VFFLYSHQGVTNGSNEEQTLGKTACNPLSQSIQDNQSRMKQDQKPALFIGSGNHFSGTVLVCKVKNLHF
jgi:hypothetical protein